jgi:hypothetical protein
MLQCFQKFLLQTQLNFFPVLESLIEKGFDLVFCIKIFRPKDFDFISASKSFTKRFEFSFYHPNLHRKISTRLNELTKGSKHKMQIKYHKGFQRTMNAILLIQTKSECLTTFSVLLGGQSTDTIRSAPGGVGRRSRRRRRRRGRGDQPDDGPAVPPAPPPAIGALIVEATAGRTGNVSWRAFVQFVLLALLGPALRHELASILWSLWMT